MTPFTLCLQDNLVDDNPPLDVDPILTTPRDIICWPTCESTLVPPENEASQTNNRKDVHRTVGSGSPRLFKSIARPHQCDICPNTRDRASSLSTSSCQCMSRALRVLEEVNLQSYLHHPPHLFFPGFKRSIQVLTVLSQCRSCCRQSTHVMMLLTLCERLSGALVTSTKELHGCPLEEISMLGELPIDTEEERCALLATFSAYSVRKFYTIITRLRKLCTSSKWPSHSAGFEELEESVLDVLRELCSMSVQGN